MDLDVGPLIKLPKGIAEDINDPIDVLKIDPLFMPKPDKETEPVAEKKPLNLSTKENEKSSSKEEPKKRLERRNSCKFCYKTFTSKEDQMEHSARAHLICSECPRMFDSRVGLRIHKAIGHGPFKCELCPNTFKSFKQRDAHRRAHMDKGPLIYSCRDCGEKFSTEEGVICHKSIYQGCCDHSKKLPKQNNYRDRRAQRVAISTLRSVKIIYRLPNDANLLVV
ncbi:Oidioi.mRNA.OKI2018_I69.YSR.g17050.t1.cds [Oikopleura dioica]|uniref:Oidioi.mRNA.OKI2018_I69.YSR.g17050.t1.cds n=1 Tax=Oikopleura dioica TaxID=34765 RepID=A0ABN7SI01_OIKDI|nr:Oidioi.mRNA.OKI2018_I69.YSR.g17050.t1.cds [Oikopleura dioica]